MKHPEVRDLALYAGGELPVWRRLWLRRHVEQCPTCTAEVDAFRQAQLELQFAAGDLPPGLNWNRLAAEMKANIRVGLAAGECVRSPEPARPRRESWRFASVAAAIVLLAIGGSWWRVARPPASSVAQQTAAAQAPKAGADQGEVVLKATMGGIGLERAGAGFALAPSRGESLAVSAETRGVLKASYVDEESGQVTIHHVYAQ